MDALQIYRRLDIGTAKPTIEERALAPHHLFDIVEPWEAYTVADYQRDARAILRESVETGSLPLLVGGTGLYLSSLYYDFTFREEEGNERAFDLLMDSIGPEGIYHRLVEEKIPGIDALQWKNPHRLRRAWVTRKVHEKSQKKRSELPLVIFHLVQPREVLLRRIALRTKRMLQGGLIEEVEGLLAEGLTDRDPAMKGIGYKETKRFLQGEISREQLEEAILVGTRQYAKRQMTWARNQYPQVISLDGTLPAEKLARIMKQEVKER